MVMRFGPDNGFRGGLATRSWFVDWRISSAMLPNRFRGYLGSGLSFMVVELLQVLRRLRMFRLVESKGVRCDAEEDAVVVEERRVQLQEWSRRGRLRGEVPGNDVVAGLRVL